MQEYWKQFKRTLTGTWLEGVSFGKRGPALEEAWGE